MNAPLRRVAISVLVLFTLLIVNVNYIQVWRSADLRADPGNTRVLSEEYDPKKKRQLGNFPQAFSHLALIDAAVSLANVERHPARHEIEPARRTCSLRDA